MHYGELNPRIRTLDPREVKVKNRVEATPTQATGGVYTGSFNGIDVVLKPLYKERGEAQILRDDPNFRLHNGTTEANALYILQGVPCVPTLYGVVTRPIVNGEGAIVEQFAKGGRIYGGTPTSSMYLDDRLLAEYFRKTGINIRKAVGSQLAGNLVGALDRGLVVRDLKDGEVFIDPKQNGVEVLRIDYGMAKDVGEVGRNDYDMIMQHTFDFIPEVGYRPSLDLFSPSELRIRQELQSKADKFRTEGLRTLPHLLSSYANGDFYQDSPEAFRQFVTLWETAMEESGRFLIERANVRQTAKETFQKRLQGMELYDALLEVHEAEKRRDAGLDYNTILSVRKQVEADGNPLLLAIMYDLRAQEFRESSRDTIEYMKKASVSLYHFCQQERLGLEMSNAYDANLSALELREVNEREAALRRRKLPELKKTGLEEMWKLEEEMWKLGDRARDNPQEAYSIIEKINGLRKTIHELDGMFYNDRIARAAFLDTRVKAKRAAGQSYYSDATASFPILRRFEDDEGIGHEMSEAYADSIIKEEKDSNEAEILIRSFDDARKSN